MPAASNATEYLGLVDDVLKPLQRQTPDDDQRYEFFAVNGESRPLYIAQAPPNTSVDALVWTIQKYTWVNGPVGSSVPSLIQTRIGSWTLRANYF